MRPEGAIEADAGGERLWLLPQRAAYWPRMQMLLVADAHLGKAAAFRSAGVPVPSGTTAENLQGLTQLLDILDVRRIVFLGDLVHNRAARDAADGAFVRWRAKHRTVDMVLVRGNHDRHAGKFSVEWGLDVMAEPYALDGLALCHRPCTVPGAYAVSGHVHPAARLAGRGREHLRLPCFHFTPECAILPAFGAFTGMADVEPAPVDRVYAVVGSQVVAVAG